MLPVVGKQCYSVAKGDCRDGYVGVGKRLALQPPVAAEQTCLTSDFRGHRQAFEAVQEGVRPCLFAETESGVDLGNVDSATCEDVPFLNEVIEKCRAAIPAVEVIEYDGGVKKDVAINGLVAG